MQAAHLDHEHLQEQSPAVITSLKSIPNHIQLTEEDKNNKNKMMNVGGDELGPTLEMNKEQTKPARTILGDENLNTMTAKPIMCDNNNEPKWKPHYLKPSCETSGDAPKRISMRRSFQRELLEDDTKRCGGGQLSYKTPNNNYDEDLLTESKAAFLDKFMNGDDSSHWKRGYGANGDFVEDLRARFPWKRIAYICILLVLGITCAILALMKLCGGADWMNTATFSVIIMGTVMLLPPGLYYGHILVCISFRCKGYSLFDVPAGPFEY